MGGDGATTFDRVLEFCDGWMPIAGRMGTDFAEKIATLQKRAKEAGRGPIPGHGVHAEAGPRGRSIRSRRRACERVGARAAVREPSDKVLPLLDALREADPLSGCSAAADGATGGLRSAHGCAASNAAAARSTAASPRRLPTICRPTGRPSRVNPHGIEIAGSPSTENA